MTYDLKHGDCLDLMKDIPDTSMDMILADPPYGTTPCKWDNVIPMQSMWEQYDRIIKNDGAICLFGTEPFASLLRVSNLDEYKYDWIWVKDNAPNFLVKKYQPGKLCEYIMVFGHMATSYSKRGNMKYYPQMTKGTPYTQKSGKQKTEKENSTVRSHIAQIVTENDGYRYPNNILEFKRDKDKFHPTQKPVALIEYLIKTYTNEGEIVLDNCMGSGSTGVACVNTNRNFIGMELDDTYFDIAKKRIEEAELEII